MVTFEPGTPGPEFDAAALTEIRDAYGYLEERSLKAADAFVAAIHASVARIVAMPNAWTPVGDAIRRCRVRGFAYWLVFEHRGHHARIVALQHDARRPGYWRERLGAGDR